MCLSGRRPSHSKSGDADQEASLNHPPAKVRGQGHPEQVIGQITLRDQGHEHDAQRRSPADGDRGQSLGIDGPQRPNIDGRGRDQKAGNQSPSRTGESHPAPAQGQRGSASPDRGPGVCVNCSSFLFKTLALAFHRIKDICVAFILLSFSHYTCVVY